MAQLKITSGRKYSFFFFATLKCIPQSIKNMEFLTQNMQVSICTVFEKQLGWYTVVSSFKIEQVS
jgi:hypothetical protein